MRATGQARPTRRAALWIGYGLAALLAGCSAERVPAPEASALESAASSAVPATASGAQTAAQTSDTEPQAAGSQMPAESGGFLGVVVTRDAVDVAAEATGRIESLAVQVGDRVSRGDLLARLDTRDLQQDLGMARSSLRAAEAEVNRIESQVHEAETRYNRRSSLPDIFAREEVEAAKMEQETARATLEAAQARVSEQETQVEQLRSRLQRAEIRAPFAGTVALRYLDPGATVLPGTAVIRLLGTEELVVRFAVPPEEVSTLHLGDPIDVALGDTGRRAPATIRHIAPEIDGPSQMVFVEARLEASDDALAGVRSGLAVRVFRG